MSRRLFQRRRKSLLTLFASDTCLLNSLDKLSTEAAEIDGANQIVIFYKIAVPVAKPGFLISFLLSMVWYWNETYLGLQLCQTVLPFLPLQSVIMHLPGNHNLRLPVDEHLPILHLNPAQKPGFLISFLLSMVWYWNETYLGALYFGANIKTLPMKLENPESGRTAGSSP